jgi:hypothetical protein
MSRSPQKLPPQLVDAVVQLLGESGRRGRVRVLGSSMEPTLVEGETLDVEFAPGPVRRGDLLVFRQADYLVVHRLLGPARFPDGRPCLRTRGDARIALDPPLDAARVVGRVSAVLRGGTWRSFHGTGARYYAVAFAFHDLAWAAAGVAARRADRVLDAMRLPSPLARWASLADRTLLGVAHRLLFDALHPRSAATVPERPSGG